MHIVTVILTIETVKEEQYMYLANIMHIVTVILTIENCQGIVTYMSCMLACYGLSVA